MAWDWRWANPGPGRANAYVVIEFCINHAAATGVQAVHDYANGRYWHSNKGWRNAKPSPSTGFGQSWAKWLHIERTWAAANLATQIGQAPPPPPPAVPGGGGACPICVARLAAAHVRSMCSHCAHDWPKPVLGLGLAFCQPLLLCQ